MERAGRREQWPRRSRAQDLASFAHFNYSPKVNRWNKTLSWRRLRGFFAFFGLESVLEFGLVWFQRVSQGSTKANHMPPAYVWLGATDARGLLASDVWKDFDETRYCSKHKGSDVICTARVSCPRDKLVCLR